jgi:hypothetical protein
MSRFVTDRTDLSPHVTDNVTDVLEKNLGKTVFVTVSPIKTPGRGGAPGTAVQTDTRLVLKAEATNSQFHFISLSNTFLQFPTLSEM